MTGARSDEVAVEIDPICIEARAAGQAIRVVGAGQADLPRFHPVHGADMAALGTKTTVLVLVGPPPPVVRMSMMTR